MNHRPILVHGTPRGKESAQAHLYLAQITAARWQNLLKFNSVSKQETDQIVSDLASDQAMVASNEANVRRLRQLQSFERVYAPFDGGSPRSVTIPSNTLLLRAEGLRVALVRNGHVDLVPIIIDTTLAAVSR